MFAAKMPPTRLSLATIRSLSYEPVAVSAGSPGLIGAGQRCTVVRPVSPRRADTPMVLMASTRHQRQWPRCVRSCGLRITDLLDANENNWASVTESYIGCAINLQFRPLVALAAENFVKFYCGLAGSDTVVIPARSAYPKSR